MDVIVLAAGNSLRFGANKLLHPLDGKQMYLHILELLARLQKEGWLEQVVVVSQYDEIFRQLEKNFPKFASVRNQTPETGISGSIRLGLHRLCQLHKESKACLFTVADQPYLTVSSIEKMLCMWRQYPHGILAACADGNMGNPVIFENKYYASLHQLTGDTGGKAIVSKHLEDTRLCEIPAAQLRDLDRIEDTVKIQEQCITKHTLKEPHFAFLEQTGHVVSVVGAGGKTTLIDTLAKMSARAGKKTLITTTTHIRRPSHYPVADHWEAAKELMQSHQIVVYGALAAQNKLTKPHDLDIANCQSQADLILIEADGAKCLPCKVPNQTEPVILKESDIVLGVAGLDAIGKPLKDVCFRAAYAMELLGTDISHCLTEEDLAFILCSEQGTRKSVGLRDYYIVLNKCDHAKRLRQAEQIKKLIKQRCMTQVVFTSLDKNTGWQ